MVQKRMTMGEEEAGDTGRSVSFEVQLGEEGFPSMEV